MAAASLALATLSGAQTAFPDGRAPAELRDFAGRAIAQLALIDLRLLAAPTRDDYAATAILLGLAQDLLPDDEMILRHRIAAAFAAGDHASVEALTRRLLEIDPSDTAAQLRLITARIATMQTIEERLAAYDRFLGPGGRSLDASVRSRLALDAALLLRERGDMKGFADRITLATTLDSTHKEAAATALAFYIERGGERLGRLDLLANLLLADPADPNLHHAIARELAAGGAPDQASRFHRNVSVIEASTVGLRDSTYVESFVLEWLAKGPEGVMSALNRQVTESRERAANAIREANLEGRPIDKLARPEEVYLTLPLGTVLVLAANDSGDRKSAETAMSELGRAVQVGVQSLLTAPQSATGMTPEQAQEQASIALAELYVLGLWADVKSDEIITHTAPGTEFRELVPELPPMVEAWRSLRSGDVERAIELFEGVRAESPVAIAGLALAREGQGDTAAALALYRQAIDAAPLDPLGAWARGRVTRLIGAQIDAETKAVRDWGDRQIRDLEWLGRALRDPRAYFALRVELEPLTGIATDRQSLRITITNLAPVPLAFGSDRALSSRILIAPSVEVPGGSFRDFARPEVINVDRRLRLMPREQVSMTVCPTSGFAGWLVETMSAQTLRVRWRVIQGFLPDSRITYRAGPLNLMTETEVQVIRPLPETALDTPRLGIKIKADGEFAMPTTLAAARTIAMAYVNPALMERPDLFGRELAGRNPFAPLVDALSTRYPTLSSAGRAAMIATMPHGRLSPPVAALDEVVRKETDPALRCLVLVTRVTSVDDELLAECEASEDERVRTVARAVRGRLERSAPSYAMLTSDAFLRRTSSAPANVPTMPAPTAPPIEAPPPAEGG